MDETVETEAQRSRMVAVLGAALALLGCVLSSLIDGDPTRAPVVVWNICALGALAILPFAGVFSAAICAPFLVVTLVNQGQSRAAALSTLATTILGHATLVTLSPPASCPTSGAHRSRTSRRSRS